MVNVFILNNITLLSISQVENKLSCFGSEFSMHFITYGKIQLDLRFTIFPMTEEFTVRGTIIETRFNYKHSHLTDINTMLFISYHSMTTPLLLPFHGISNIQVNRVTHGSLYKIECFCTLEGVNHQAPMDKSSNTYVQ